MLRSPLAALVAVAFLAGCASPGTQSEATSAPEPDFGELGLEATSSTGILRGAVVDDALRPIEGATVVLTGEVARRTVTTEVGTFGFEGLPPGTYFVTASKAGYFDAQEDADVVAGVPEPPVVKLQMTADFYGHMPPVGGQS